MRRQEKFLKIEKICHLMAMLRLFTASVVNTGRVAVDSEVKALLPTLGGGT